MRRGGKRQKTAPQARPDRPAKASSAADIKGRAGGGARGRRARLGGGSRRRRVSHKHAGDDPHADQREQPAQAPEHGVVRAGLPRRLQRAEPAVDAGERGVARRRGAAPPLASTTVGASRARDQKNTRAASQLARSVRGSTSGVIGATAVAAVAMPACSLPDAARNGAELRSCGDAGRRAGGGCQSSSGCPRTQRGPGCPPAASVPAPLLSRSCGERARPAAPSRRCGWPGGVPAGWGAPTRRTPATKSGSAARRGGARERAPAGRAVRRRRERRLPRRASCPACMALPHGRARAGAHQHEQSRGEQASEVGGAGGDRLPDRGIKGLTRGDDWHEEAVEAGHGLQQGAVPQVRARPERRPHAHEQHDCGARAAAETRRR